MFGKFHKAKRRLKQEWKGLKYIFRSEEGKKIIRASYLVYQASRVIYNPWHLLDIIFANKLIKNL